MLHKYSAVLRVIAIAALSIAGATCQDGNGVVNAPVNAVSKGSISIAPSRVSLSAQGTQQFTATVNGNSNAGLNWSLGAPVGTISSTGLYTAPSTIASPQSVNVIVTSAADPTRSASATVSLLVPVTVLMTPSTSSLSAGQTQQFIATVGGTLNRGVTWSLSAPVGTISSTGLYTAPASISSAQSITVTATSIADATKSASGTISLAPPVSVSVTPSYASLTPSQSVTLTASVTGASNTGVTWSLNPPVGGIASSGATAIYTAPGTILNSQNVTITATSMADPTKSTSTLIALVQAVTLSVSPLAVTLAPGGTQQFTATVSGTSNNAVTWSINPPVGTIDSTGLYTAPSTLLAQQAVAVTAQSVADPAKKATSTVSLQPPSRIQFTFDTNRLTSLSYGGLSYYQYMDSIVGSAVFRSPDGTESDTGLLSITSAVRTKGANYFQHVYNSGQRHQFTIKFVWTQPDNRTLKVDAYVTDNDATDTLARIGLSFLPVALPGPIVGQPVHQSIMVDQFFGEPAGFVSGDWGSLAVWQDYPTPARILAAYNSLDQNWLNLGLFNYSSRTFGVSSSGATKYYEAAVDPGQTQHLTYYLRLGTSTDTVATLAPEALDSYRAAFPNLVNWPDRRPIGSWFIAEGAKHASATNPRGYLADPTLNASDIFTFFSRVLTKADEIINRMNAMTPKPQGIVIWNLEGEEFAQPFTYVGYPNMLPVIAPEMDFAADQMFSKFRNAGYLVGITLRASTFNAGSQLPSSCQAGDGVVSFPDVFINTSATYPYRGYVCNTSNTWTQPGAHLPSFQTISDDDNLVLQELIRKVSYARSRWNARLFYVDSTVYIAGNALVHSIFRALQQQFPDCLFMPEEKSAYYPGATAPYGEPYSGMLFTPVDWRLNYPSAFSVINAAHADLVGQYNGLLTAIRSGDIMLFSAWYDSPEIRVIQQLYAAK